MKTVFTHGGENPFVGAKAANMIELKQQESGKRLFTLVYGLAVKKGLTYEQACKALGQVILHFECCEGNASNEGA
jgi:hypothetical protein